MKILRTNSDARRSVPGSSALGCTAPRGGVLKVAGVVVAPVAMAVALGFTCHAASAQMAGETPGLYSASFGSPSYTCVTNFYVDGTNGNDSNPGTASRPWKTIQNADNGYPNVPTAGECVNILPGTYNLAKTIIIAHGGNQNSPTGYVVYRSTVPQAAHLVAQSSITSGANGDMIMLWAPYVIFDGLHVDGNHATTGHGIDGCANGGQPGNIAHHITVVNSIVHDVGGSGLSTCSADFITWSHNVVYGTSGTNLYQTSAVNVWEPRGLAPGSYTPTAADAAPYGIVISYNVVFNNAEGPTIPGGHTDGNGIIIDTTFGSSNCPTCGTPYPGNILVLGNVSYNNGGGGIHVFLSENVTIANNTVYHNYLDPLNPGSARGELSNGGSRNVNWINNVAVAVPGSGPTAYNRAMVTFPVGSFPDSGTWTSNIGYGAGVQSDSSSYINPATNLLGVNPMLTSMPDGLFAPLPGSPAIGRGTPQSFLSSAKPNIGAY